MSGSTTIEDLTRYLPTDYVCCARTVRRDFQALEECLPTINTVSVEDLSRVSTPHFFARELMAPLFTRDVANRLGARPYI